MEDGWFDTSLSDDYGRMSRFLGRYVFHYGPPVWRLGITAHYDCFDQPGDSDCIAELLQRCQISHLHSGSRLYRVRKNVGDARTDPISYDTPPADPSRAYSRFDAPDLEVFYGSLNIEACIHECRGTLNDDIVLATFEVLEGLRLLDLESEFQEPDIETEFESFYPLVQGLLMTGRARYEKCRVLSESIRDAGYQGFRYRSYYSQVDGLLRFNIALFGRPVESGILKLQSLNVVRIEEIKYKLSFGPVIV